MRFRSVLLFFFAIVSSTVSHGETVDIRVMTWNVADMDIFDGEGTQRIWEQVQTEIAIADVIRAVNPDVLLLVEAPSYTELEGFIVRNSLIYELAHVRQQVPRRDFADGMALLSRIPIGGVSLETPAVPGSVREAKDFYKDWSYRGLLVADLAGITVVGVHLKSPWDGKERSYLTREAQARALTDYLQTLNGALLVLGDFNDGPGFDEKEILFSLSDTIGILESSLQRASGGGITQEDGFDVDHIFVRGASIGLRHIVETDWELSDHRPVWADISLIIIQ